MKQSKIKLFKIYPTLKKPITVYSMEEKIPQSVMNQSESLSKTIENLENLKEMTFRKIKKRNNNNDYLNNTLTEKDDDYISNIYTSYNQNGEQELTSRYNLNSQLNEFQKTSIQHFFRKSHKDNSIFAHSVDNKELYSNPFKSQHDLNFNKNIYKTLNNIRMEHQFNCYTRRINDYHQKEKKLKLMPKVKISKITSDINNNVKKSKIKKKIV